jgi:hypothetical protein
MPDIDPVDDLLKRLDVDAFNHSQAFGTPIDKTLSARAAAQIRSLRQFVQSAQWSARDDKGCPTCCPVCLNHKSKGHAKDCPAREGKE